jgi:hypothetical protein
MVLDGAYYETYRGNTRYCTFHAAEAKHLEKFESCGGRSLVVEIESAWLQSIHEVSGIRLDAIVARKTRHGPLDAFGGGF